MRGRADLAGLRLIGAGGIEQAKPRLHAQDAANRIVDPRHRDRTGLGGGERAVEQALPAVGRHRHVEPGVEGRGAAGGGAAGDLGMAVPVADDEAVKPHPALQHIGQQRAVAVHLLPVPAGERGHDRHRARVDRWRIARRMDADQRVLGHDRVALVDPARRAAVAQIMLRAGGDMAVLDAVAAGLALQPLDHRAGIAAHQCRILRIALIGAAPAIVLRHGQRRSERPVDPRRGRLRRGRRADPPDQVGIMRRAQRAVVREERRANDVVVAMDGVDAEH